MRQLVRDGQRGEDQRQQQLDGSVDGVKQNWARAPVLAELRPPGRGEGYPHGWNGYLSAALRSVAWGNLGVLKLPAGASVDTVTFVSNAGASNLRRLVDEAIVAKAVRRMLTRVRPEWRMRLQGLESLSFANEVRLLRRTKVFISLFSASLTNCIFVPPGGLVIQIHGALRGEIEEGAALSQYKERCPEKHLGIKLLGYAAFGWKRIYGPDTDSPDFSSARVDPDDFAHFLERALDEQQWPVLEREFIDAIKANLSSAETARAGDGAGGGILL